jgi:hypothetical protein
MITEQPNCHPEAAEREPQKTSARSAQFNEMVALRLCYRNNVDAAHVVPLLAAAV